MEEVKRKLASIRIISEIKPIEGADSIELAIVDGWQCVVKKGEFMPGSLCVYFEIDSFLPIRPEFEFLRKSSYKKMEDKEGFRLKTIRLRGQISQGLVLSLKDVFPDNHELINKEGLSFPSVVGLDVTEELGILKYESPIPACLTGMAKGNFPSFIRKTDLERVQNIWNKVKDDNQLYEVTVKLDGTSCTFYLNNGIFGVCSRNLELKEDCNNVYWKMAKKYNIEEALRHCGHNIALQGEIIGEGIQGNHEGIGGQEFYLFDIWDIDDQSYFSPVIRRILVKSEFSHFGIKECPILANLLFDNRAFLNGYLSLSHFNGDIYELLKFADGKSLKADTREGVVFKGVCYDTRFKVLSNEYLLKAE